MVCRVGNSVEVFGRCNFLLFILLSVFLGSCQNKETLPYYNTADFTPLWDMDTVKSPVHRIAEFSLIDQDNQLISNAMFDGKIYVANFFFTSCPSICPRMTSNLKFVADQFKNNNEVLFISHSLTPWIDSVARLKDFASQHNIRSSQWHLVTGRKEEINMLARRSYFAEEELGLTKDSTGFVHTEHCLLIDRERRIRGIYNGTLRLEMQRLAEDIKVLIQE